jgi:hypothetical protein
MEETNNTQEENKGYESDYSKAGEGNHPHSDHMTDDGFVKWYDQKNFGTKRGSFGLPQQTNGKAMTYTDFVATIKNSKLQGE